MFSAFFRSLKQEFAGYNSKKLLADMMAGLTVCAVALPLALAFGVSSGASAAAGLVTAIIAGVVIAALILILAPEYLRAFSEYRMLIFGAIMVIMMIFRPQGLISGERRRYRISALHGAHNGGRA